MRLGYKVQVVCPQKLLFGMQYKKKRKEKKRRTIPPTIYKESQVVFFKRKAYKAGSFHFPILASTLVC